MRIARCWPPVLGATVVATLALLRLAVMHDDNPRRPGELKRPAAGAQPFQPQGLRQQQLLGINPDRMMLLAPPADTSGALASPARR